MAASQGHQGHLGASGGIKGAEHGHKGAVYGKLGGCVKDQKKRHKGVQLRERLEISLLMRKIIAKLFAKW